MVNTLTWLAVADPMDEVVPHTLFSIGGFSYTNHMMMVTISATAMLILFPLLARHYPVAPTGVRAGFELILEFVRTGVAKPVLGVHTDRFMPFLWTLFFFILINNVLGLFPLDAMAELFLHRGHMFGVATSGLSVTAGLAMVAFVAVHVSGILEQIHQQRDAGRSFAAAMVIGFFFYWYRIVPHIPGVLGIIMFLPLLALELVGAVIKPFALAMRLFANLMAGHLVLGSLVILVPVIHGVADAGTNITILLGCVALSCLELFVAFLQAYIFTFLTCMFIGTAVSPEH